MADEPKSGEKGIKLKSSKPTPIDQIEYDDDYARKLQKLYREDSLDAILAYRIIRYGVFFAFFFDLTNVVYKQTMLDYEPTKGDIGLLAFLFLVAVTPASKISAWFRRN
jgi:hypothetical protein